jgi:hypothetical protein
MCPGAPHNLKTEAVCGSTSPSPVIYPSPHTLAVPEDYTGPTPSRTFDSVCYYVIPEPTSLSHDGHSTARPAGQWTSILPG